MANVQGREGEDGLQGNQAKPGTGQSNRSIPVICTSECLIYISEYWKTYFGVFEFTFQNVLVIFQSIISHICQSITGIKPCVFIKTQVMNIIIISGPQARTNSRSNSSFDFKMRINWTDICRDNWRPGSGLVFSGYNNQTEGVVGYKSDYSDYNINIRKGSDCLNKGEQTADYSDYSVGKGEPDLNIIDCYNRATDAGAEFLFYRKNETNNESFLRSKQTLGNESLFGGKQTNKRLDELKGRVGEIRSSPSPERRRINSPLLVRFLSPSPSSQPLSSSW